MEQAVRRGLQPILCGRDTVRLQRQANPLGLEYRPISLDDSNALDVALKETSSGIELCRTFPAHLQTHCGSLSAEQAGIILDITGEIAVFEAIAAQDAAARKAGIMLLPGIGFDVVPSDCLQRT